MYEMLNKLRIFRKNGSVSRFYIAFCDIFHKLEKTSKNTRYSIFCKKWTQNVVFWDVEKNDEITKIFVKNVEF